MILAPTLTLLNSRGSIYDPAAVEFFARAGVTDVASKRQISDIVKGIKAAGVWNNTVCWPMRSSQNAGTGTTVYSLGGLGIYNGTLVNGPTWGADGINRNSATAVVQITADATLRNASTVLVAFKSSVTADNQRGICCAGTLTGDNYYQTTFNSNTVKQAYLSATRGGTSTAGEVANSTGRETAWNFWGASLGSTSQQSFFNGTPGTLSTGLGTRNPTGSVNVFIGSTDVSSSPARGDYSFALLSSQQMSGATMTALYALYKSTLGQGLGLP